MLVLTRRAGESIMIGDDVRVVVLDVRGDTVRLGVEAPREVGVHRTEVYADIQRQTGEAMPEIITRELRHKNHNHSGSTKRRPGPVAPQPPVPVPVPAPAPVVAQTRAPKVEPTGPKRPEPLPATGKMGKMHRRRPGRKKH